LNVALLDPHLVKTTHLKDDYVELPSLCHLTQISPERQLVKSTY